MQDIADRIVVDSSNTVIVTRLIHAFIRQIDAAGGAYLEHVLESRVVQDHVERSGEAAVKEPA